MNESSADGFSNVQIARAELPDYRDVEFEPVARSFRRYTLISTVSYWLPALLVASAINLLPDVTLLPGMMTPLAVALLAAVVATYRWIDAGWRGWAMREHDVIACHGILWRSTTTLPFARIQHVETSSGPLERAMKLARLKLFTAGGMTADLILIGLDAATADQLREHLAEQIRRRDAAGDTGQIGADDA
jgi:membrane protein YdbS with pleckstrin-like domain